MGEQGGGRNLKCDRPSALHILRTAHFAGHHPRSPGRRNDEFNQPAALSVCETQFSTKFLSSLFHPTDANSHTIRLLLCNPLSDSLPITLHRTHVLSFFFIH